MKEWLRRHFLTREKEKERVVRRLEGGQPGSIKFLCFPGKHGRQEQALSEALRPGYFSPLQRKDQLCGCAEIVGGIDSHCKGWIL